MPSSSATVCAVVLAASLACLPASVLAQQPYPGFAVERLDLAAPGAGWLGLDSLDMHGALGGVMAFTLGYSHNPLQIRDGGTTLPAVSDQAFADIGLALTFHRFRLWANFTSPLWITGQGGTVDGYTVTAPSVDPASHPDLISDVRLGIAARVLGEAVSAIRLGVSAELFVPNGNPTDDVTDGTFRAMFRVHVAGDFGHFTYAAHVGLHLRPLDTFPVPEAPQGSEFIAGLGAGARWTVGAQRDLAVIVGPEILGATALRAAFGGTSTALEALLGARIEGTRDAGMQLRFKLGAGAGLDPHFGAPDWRVLVGIEAFNRDLRP